MKQTALGLLILFVAFQMTHLYGDDRPRIYMPDGQLISKPIRVYVSGTNLSDAMQPRLRLVGQTMFAKGKGGSGEFPARRTIPGQYWSEEVAGQSISQEGTLLLFDALTGVSQAGYVSEKVTQERPPRKTKTATPKSSNV